LRKSFHCLKSFLSVTENSSDAREKIPKQFSLPKAASGFEYYQNRLPIDIGFLIVTAIVSTACFSI
ncbi:MAG: hypothetical protein RR933_08200, partial [Oscillospiraceae bacterium]